MQSCSTRRRFLKFLTIFPCKYGRLGERGLVAIPGYPFYTEFMTVDETVRNFILRYPSLFPNRLAVLEHLLVVIGNGFEWVDGVPVETMPDNTEPWTAEYEWTMVQSSFTAGMLDIMTPHDLQKFKQEHIEPLQRVVNEVDRRMHSMDPKELRTGEFHPYPRSKYAMVLTAPEDITDEWAEACVEMLDVLTAHGW
jgi:hypothetical protein